MTHFGDTATNGLNAYYHKVNMSNQFQLLKEQRFRPFFFTQFLGAFNDNVFKTALITLVAFHASSATHMDGAKLATLLPGLFILPFFCSLQPQDKLPINTKNRRLFAWSKSLKSALCCLLAQDFFTAIFGYLPQPYL